MPDADETMFDVTRFVGNGSSVDFDSKRWCFLKVCDAVDADLCVTLFEELTDRAGVEMCDNTGAVFS